MGRHQCSYSRLPHILLYRPGRASTLREAQVTTNGAGRGAAVLEKAHPGTHHGRHVLESVHGHRDQPRSALHRGRVRCRCRHARLGIERLPPCVGHLPPPRGEAWRLPGKGHRLHGRDHHLRRRGPPHHPHAHDRHAPPLPVPAGDRRRHDLRKQRGPPASGATLSGSTPPPSTPGSPSGRSSAAP